MKKNKIICLCGSTKFYEDFDEANFNFTIQGYIVLNIGCNTKSDYELFKTWDEIKLGNLKKELDELHRRKIDLCDEIFVINKGGYIGESTRSEIEYAMKIGKPIKYMEMINKNEQSG